MNVQFNIKNGSTIIISCHDVEKTLQDYIFYDENYKYIMVIKSSYVDQNSFKYN